VTGVPFSNLRYRKGVPFLSKWYMYNKRVKGWELRAVPPRIGLCRIPTPPPLPWVSMPGKRSFKKRNNNNV